jgi:hypothetical protein
MTTFSDENWSSPEADLSPEDFAKCSLIDLNKPGEPKVKGKIKLPIRSTPGGPVNKAALKNAAGRIFQMTGVPADEKKKAAKTLVRLMREAGIEVGSNSLLRLAGMA